ncbi:MAG: ATP synthase F1 subunit delta [Anaerostipes sp.]|jgi:F-type H+-transporting ATPase subunit delta|nr:ATP synthase F1 subunit delta [Anaerostipes sp.]
MAKLVSKTYGDAYISLALEKGNLTEEREEVTSFLKIFQENEDLYKMLHHPKVVVEEKMRVMEQIFKGKVSDDFMGFLLIIMKKGRAGDMLSIFEYVISQMKRYEGIGILEVVSAVELTGKQKKEIENRMLELTDYKTLEVDYKVDETLIGGLILRMDDRVVDNSIKNKLDSMARSLSQIQL